MSGSKKTKAELIEELEALNRRIRDLEQSGKAGTLERKPERYAQSRQFEQELERLKPNDHLCLFYESEEEWRAVVIPFLSVGFRKGEKCIYIVDIHTAAQIRKSLQTSEIDVSEAEKSGQLVIIHKTDAYTQDGLFDPDRMIEMLERQAKKASEDGYSGIRLTEEKSARPSGYLYLERLLEYEAKLNERFFPRYRCTMLCQYDRKKSDPSMIRNAIMTHPSLIRNYEVHQNFYYVSSGEFMIQRREERQVQDWLTSVEQKEWSERRALFLWDVIERSTQPLTVSYPDGHIMFCNEAFRTLTGYTEEELNRLTWSLDLTPVERREYELDKLEQLRKTGRAERYETECLHKDGSRIPIEVLIHQISDDEGNPRYFCTFITDIRERKQKSEELKEQMEKFKTLFDSSPVSLWEEDFSRVKESLDSLKESGIVDLETHLREHPEVVERLVRKVRVVDVNSTTLQIFGARDKSEILRGLDAIFTKESYGAFRKELEAIEKGYSSCETEVDARTLSGEKKSFIMRWTVAPGCEETFSKVIVSLVDVTQMRQAQKDKEEYESRLETIFDNTAQALMLLDRNGMIQAFNATAKKWGRSWLGREVHEGDSVFDFIPAESMAPFEERFRKAMKGISSHGDGQVQGRWVEFSYVPVRRGDDVSGVCLTFLNIDDRVRARRELEEKEAWFGTLVKYSSDVIVIVTKDGIVSYVSDSVQRVLGREASSLVGRDFFEIIHPQELFSVRLALTSSVERGGILVTNEFRLRHGDGSWVWVDAVGRNLLEDVHVRGVVLNVRDIGERKKTEEKLRETKEEFQSLLEGSSEVTVVVDRDLTVRYQSSSIERVLGYKPSERVGKKVSELIHPDDLTRVRNGFMRAMENPEELVHDAIRVRHRDGSWRVVEATAKNLLANPAVHGIVINYHDITDRKVAEMAVQEAKTRYENLAESLSELIYRADVRTLSPTYVNSAVKRFYGYTQKQWLSTPDLWKESIHPEDRKRVFKEIQEARKRGRGVVVEYRIVRKDKRIRWVEDHVSWERDDQGRISSADGVMHDVTLRKRAEAEITRRERIARERALLLSELRNLDVTDEILARVCRSIRDSGLFERAVMTLHRPGGEIVSMGYVGLPRRAVQRARKGPPLSRKLRRKIMSARFRISNSFFVPAEARLDYGSSDRYLPESDQPSKEGDWKAGDELFVPLDGFSGETIGFLSVDTPIDGRRPDLESVRALEMLVDAAARRVQEVHALRVVERERDFSRSIVETANSLVVCLDSDARIVVFNDESERVTGYRRKEVIGKHWPSLFLPPDERHPGLRSFAEWVRAHPRDRYEGRIVIKNGEERTILWSNTMIEGDEERGILALAIGQDVTERTRARELLEESEKRFKELANLLPQTVFETDLAGKIIFANQHALKTAGYSRDDLTKGVSVFSVLAPEQKPMIEKNIRKILRGGASTGNQYVAIRKDGTRYPVMVYSAPILMKGKPVGLRGVVVDISEERELAEELARARDYVEAIFNSVRDGIFVTDLEKRRFVTCNKAIQRIYGYTKEEIIGKSARMFHADDASFKKIGRKQLSEIRTKGYMEGQILQRRKDGTSFLANASGTLLRDRDGNPSGLVVVVRDPSGE